MATVTVSVVSHGQGGIVKLLLEDLSKYSSRHIEKVVLTCNVPEDLPFAADQFRFSLKIVNNFRPAGFGTNHNEAFKHCGGSWFLVVNPDVRFEADVLDGLLRRAKETTGLVSPQEVDYTGKSIQNLRGLITPLEIFERHFLRMERPPPAENGWVKGMFMLLRAKAFHQVGGFDSRYFLYCEDFDLCARLYMADWGIIHTPDIHVIHGWQRESSHKPSRFWHHIRSLVAMWTSGAFWQYAKLISKRL